MANEKAGEMLSELERTLQAQREEVARRDPRNHPDYQQVLGEAADMVQGNRNIAEEASKNSYQRSVQRHNELYNYKSNSEADFSRRELELNQQAQLLADQESELENNIKVLELPEETASEARGILAKAREQLRLDREALKEERRNFPKRIEQVQTRQEADDKTQNEIAQNQEGFAVDTLLQTHKTVGGKNYEAFKDPLLKEVPEVIKKREQMAEEQEKLKRSQERLDEDKKVLDAFDEHFARFKEQMEGLFAAEQSRVLFPQFQETANALKKNIENKLNVWAGKKRAAGQAQQSLDELWQMREEVYKNLHIAIDNAILDFISHQTHQYQDSEDPSLATPHPYIHGPHAIYLPENKERAQELEQLSNDLHARQEDAKKSLGPYRLEMKAKIEELFDRVVGITLSHDQQGEYERRIREKMYR